MNRTRNMPVIAVVSIALLVVALLQVGAWSTVAGVIVRGEGPAAVSAAHLPPSGATSRGDLAASPRRSEFVDAPGGIIPTAPRIEPRERTSWLDAVRAWALDLPAADGRLGMVGFSWGGSAAFAYAVDRPELDALVVYYGETPEAESDYARIDTPVLGLYGGDLRTAATVPRAVAAMAAAGKSFESSIYDGATVFLKAQEGLDANRRATEDAWPRTLAFLRRHLAD